MISTVCDYVKYHNIHRVVSVYYAEKVKWRIFELMIRLFTKNTKYPNEFLNYLPYFTDYKTHFFLRKIASKIQVCLILEINIKMSCVWFKISTILKNGHIFDAARNLSLSGNIGFNWRQQCTDATNMSCGDSQAC